MSRSTVSSRPTCSPFVASITCGLHLDADRKLLASFAGNAVGHQHVPAAQTLVEGPGETGRHHPSWLIEVDRRLRRAGGSSGPHARFDDHHLAAVELAGSFQPVLMARGFGPLDRIDQAPRFNAQGEDERHIAGDEFVVGAGGWR